MNSIESKLNSAIENFICEVCDSEENDCDKCTFDYVVVDRNRLADLEDTESLLLSLQSWGVDSWSGYSAAYSDYLGEV